jgi:hypothetical protein
LKNGRSKEHCISDDQSNVFHDVKCIYVHRRKNSIHHFYIIYALGVVTSSLSNIFHICLTLMQTGVKYWVGVRLSQKSEILGLHTCVYKDYNLHYF